MLYAHTKEDAPITEWQSLEDHLTAVSELAGAFAEPFGGTEWASLLGKVHDLGKASDAFQKRLAGGKELVDHSTFGAQFLCERYKQIGELLSYLVCGHHGGLPNGKNGQVRSSLDERLNKTIDSINLNSIDIDLPSYQDLFANAPSLLHDAQSKEQFAFSTTFMMRMLYSSLVDADFLDTERFVDSQKAALRHKRGMTLKQMKETLSHHMDRLSKGEKTPVNIARADIHDACVAAAQGGRGIYTLTVPTGGGKTLSSLAFALEHAIKNGQQRVIYAIPFTSIIEQTSMTFKSLFGADSVLEHHSAYAFHESGDGDSERFIRERLAMENWDAPLIVTTNVQLFESLYADNPSRCRKNHNLANSVIIFDEAQSIPDGVLTPCLAALEELSAHYGTTVVLCTATQPALEAVWPFQIEPTEIVASDRRHADVFDSRVQIQSVGELSEEALVSRLREHSQVLCVVSTRRAAGEIYDLLAMDDEIKGLFHLSALMVPAHRSELLTRIKERLSNGLPCTVISTQLIEAGVDIDFPVVYREIAGIDSIKQAAGRCNREGRSDIGQVYVFDCPETRIRKYWLGRMRALGEETIASLSNPFGDEGVGYFFRARYQVQETDEYNIMKEFANPDAIDARNLPFETCGHEFRMIADEGTNIFIPWSAEGMDLLTSLRNDSLTIEAMRMLQRYSVNVAPWQRRKLEEQSAIAQEGSLGIWVLEPREGLVEGYSESKGLLLEDEEGACTI